MLISNRIGNLIMGIGNLILVSDLVTRPIPIFAALRPAPGMQRGRVDQSARCVVADGLEPAQSRSGYRSIGNHGTIGNRSTSKVTVVTAVTDGASQVGDRRAR